MYFFEILVVVYYSVKRDGAKRGIGEDDDLEGDL